MTAYAEDLSWAFLHVPKAAGKSAKTYLAEHLDDVKGQFPPDVNDGGTDGFPKGHLNLRQLCRVLGKDPSDFGRILAVRRNPYEQQFSQWRYWRRMRTPDSELGKALMPQHEVAIMHPTFEAWLKDPRSQYHVYYDHLHRDEETNLPKQTTGLGYSDFGGFYRYFLGQENYEIPENVTVIDINDLDERLPEIVAELSGEEPEDSVPRRNEGPEIEQTLEEALTPGAAKIIEDRFQYAFDEWYDRRYVDEVKEKEEFVV